jgi:hypothetical protein
MGLQDTIQLDNVIKPKHALRAEFNCTRDWSVLAIGLSTSLRVPKATTPGVLAIQSR